MIVRMVALVICLSTVLASCSWVDGDEARGTIGPSGGTVGTSGAPAQVSAPVGAVARDVEVTVAPGATPAAEPTPYARDAGTPVEITTSAPLPGAEVRIPVDLDALRGPDGIPPPARSIFVAVHEPALGVWLPLDSRFDPATSQVAAVAPHFSSFKAMVADMSLPLVISVPDPRNGLEALVNSQVFEAFFNERKTTECGPASREWQVRSPDERLEACVDVLPDGRSALLLENGFRFPVLARIPAGFALGDSVYDQSASLAHALTRAASGVSGSAAVDGRGRSQLVIGPADAATRLAPGRSIEVPISVDTFGFGLDVFISALSFFPPAKVTFRAAGEIVARGFFAQMTREGVRGREIYVRLAAEIRKEVDVEAGAVAGALACAAQNSLDSQEAADRAKRSPGRLTEITASLLDKVKACAGSVVDLLKEAGRNVPELAKVVLAVPDAVRVIAASSDGIVFNTKTFGVGSRITLTRPLPLPADLDYLLGTWTGRGRGLTVEADGTALMTLRGPRCSEPFALPGEPCEADGQIGSAEAVLRLRMMPTPAGTAGRVETSNTPRYRVGQTIPFRHGPDHQLLYPDRATGVDYELNLCHIPKTMEPTDCG